MRRFRFLIISVILMGVLAGVILLYPSGETKDKPQVIEEEKVAVVVANVDIPENTVITDKMLVYAEMPVSAVHPNAINDINSVVGATALANISSKEVILSNHILSAGQKADGLALILEEGQRAMSISVDATTGVSFLMKVGNHVDLILVSKQLQDKYTENGVDQRRNVSKMLLENIEIVALFQALNDAPVDGNGYYQYSTVTLAVTPEQAVKLALALKEGTIYVVLRPQDDETVIEDNYTVTVKDIIG